MKSGNRIELQKHIYEVVSGVSLAFVLKIAGASLAFLFQVAVGRLLGAEGAGLYYLALAITSICSVIGRVGVDHSILRFVASYGSLNEWGSVTGVYELGLKVVFAASSAITVAMFVAAPYIASAIFGKPDLAGPLQWMSLSILPFSLISLHVESLKGLKAIGPAIFTQAVIVPLMGLVLIFPLVSVANIIGAAAAYALASFICAFVAIKYWFRVVREKKDGHAFETTFPADRLWESCLPLFLVSVLNRAVLPWSGIVVLGMYATSDEVGVLGMATRVTLILGVLLQAINSVVAPKYVEVMQSGDALLLKRTVQSVALLISLLATPIFITIFIGAEFILGVFGSDFVSGVLVLKILLVGQFFNLLAGPVGKLLIMSGNESLFKNITIISVFFMIFGLFTVTPTYGLIGAAASTTCGLILLNLISLLYAKKVLGFWPVPTLAGLPKKRLLL
jgi:O-antigen/teichoic acid export membrane protein